MKERENCVSMPLCAADGELVSLWSVATVPRSPIEDGLSLTVESYSPALGLAEVGKVSRDSMTISGRVYSGQLRCTFDF